MPAGCPYVGNGATSQSNSVIDRNVVVDRRDDISMASRPLANRDSSFSASTSRSVGTTP